MIKIDRSPVLFSEGDTDAQRAQKLNDFVVQIVNAVTEISNEFEALQKKVKRMEE